MTLFYYGMENILLSFVIHTTPVYVLLENAIHCIFHLYIIWEYPAITYNTANLPQCLEDLYSTWCFSPVSGIKAFKRLKIILCRLWLVLWFRGPKHCPGLLCSQVELYKLTTASPLLTKILDRQFEGIKRHTFSCQPVDEVNTQAELLSLIWGLKFSLQARLQLADSGFTAPEFVS